jgi:hypothetical protein
MPFSKYKQKFINTKKDGAVSDWIIKVTDPHALILNPLIDRLTILVSGGMCEKSMVSPDRGNYKKLLNREVKLPANWEKLLYERQ